MASCLPTHAPSALRPSARPAAATRRPPRPPAAGPRPPRPRRLRGRSCPPPATARPGAPSPHPSPSLPASQRGSRRRPAPPQSSCLPPSLSESQRSGALPRRLAVSLPSSRRRQGRRAACGRGRARPGQRQPPPLRARSIHPAGRCRRRHAAPGAAHGSSARGGGGRGRRTSSVDLLFPERADPRVRGCGGHPRPQQARGQRVHGLASAASPRRPAAPSNFFLFCEHSVLSVRTRTEPKEPKPKFVGSYI